MLPFEEEEQEPVAVVRTLSDFALALTLVVLMLIGTRSAADAKRLPEAHAATPQEGSTTPELTLLLTSGGKFAVRSGEPTSTEFDAASVARRWMPSHPNAPATVVLEFPPKTLARDLHRALLDLQAAFGTNLARIETTPQP